MPGNIGDIPDCDRASEINLEKNELPMTKTLGVSWTANDDQFLFHYTPPSDQFQYTKRNVLRSTATIFDPMGFLAPFVVRAKLLLQQAWVLALDWDEPLTNELQEAWRQWFGELVMLPETQDPSLFENCSYGDEHGNSLLRRFREGLLSRCLRPT